MLTTGMWWKNERMFGRTVLFEAIKFDLWHFSKWKILLFSFDGIARMTFLPGISSGNNMALPNILPFFHRMPVINITSLWRSFHCDDYYVVLCSFGWCIWTFDIKSTETQSIVMQTSLSNKGKRLGFYHNFGTLYQDYGTLYQHFGTEGFWPG